jgi:hypothetical protein
MLLLYGSAGPDGAAVFDKRIAVRVLQGLTNDCRDGLPSGLRSNCGRRGHVDNDTSKRLQMGSGRWGAIEKVIVFDKAFGEGEQQDDAAPKNFNREEAVVNVRIGREQLFSHVSKVCCKVLITNDIGLVTHLHGRCAGFCIEGR